MSFSLAVLLIGLRLPRPDVVLANTHVFAVELACIVLARLKRAKIVIEFSDLIPECLALVGVAQNSLRARFLRTYFNLCFRLSDWVALPGATMAPHLVRRGVPASKLLLLPHAADPTRLDRADGAAVRERFRLEGRFVVIYAGSFSEYYDVINLARAGLLLEERGAPVALLLLGVGKQYAEVRAILDAARSQHVHLVGGVDPEGVADYLRVADLCITSLVGENTPDFYCDYPTTKVCEYLMAGRAILAVEDRPVMGPLLGRIGAGRAIPGHAPAALADAILELHAENEVRARWGAAGRRYAERHMDRLAVTTAFVSELERRMASVEASANGARL